MTCLKRKEEKEKGAQTLKINDFQSPHTLTHEGIKSIASANINE